MIASGLSSQTVYLSAQPTWLRLWLVRNSSDQARARTHAAPRRHTNT